MAVPKYDELFNPVLHALQSLGGSGSVSEIEDRVTEILRLTDKEAGEIHRGSETKISYRLAWTRNYLKRYGLLENSSHGVWTLTPKGRETKSVNKDEVNRYVKAKDKEAHLIDSEDLMSTGREQISALWEERLHDELLKLNPAAFERLCQRILRESGFTQVEVTGRSGDGGIDGRGIIKIGGLLSFHIIFQCKRYVGKVSAEQIRDFRGAMQGRADKGLFITTGGFTREAKTEATRDGAPPIDLIEGDDLVEKMRELGLGVKIQTEEVVEIDQEWLKNI